MDSGAKALTYANTRASHIPGNCADTTADGATNDGTGLLHVGDADVPPI
jgi:hypothetical protein